MYITIHARGGTWHVLILMLDDDSLRFVECIIILMMGYHARAKVRWYGWQYIALYLYIEYRWKRLGDKL